MNLVGCQKDELYAVDKDIAFLSWLDGINEVHQIIFTCYPFDQLLRLLMLNCYLRDLAFRINISFLNFNLSQYFLLARLQKLQALADECQNGLLVQWMVHATDSKMSEQQFDVVRSHSLPSQTWEELH